MTNHCYCRKCGTSITAGYFSGGMSDICGFCSDKEKKNKAKKRQESIGYFIKKGYKPSDLAVMGFETEEIKQYYFLL